MAEDEILFALLAEKKDDPQPLYLHGLPVMKLYEHVVVPYEENRPFFIDLHRRSSC